MVKMTLKVVIQKSYSKVQRKILDCEDWETLCNISMFSSHAITMTIIFTINTEKSTV